MVVARPREGAGGGDGVAGQVERSFAEKLGFGMIIVPRRQCSSTAEQRFCKPQVRGSNPLAGSTEDERTRHGRRGGRADWKFGGQVPEWTKGTDCKSVGYCLRRFESSPAHQHTELGGRSSTAERWPSKPAVVGSNPIARSTYFDHRRRAGDAGVVRLTAPLTSCIISGCWSSRPAALSPPFPTRRAGGVSRRHFAPVCSTPMDSSGASFLSVSPQSPTRHQQARAANMQVRAGMALIRQTTMLL